jgi:hypothetical protein
MFLEQTAQLSPPGPEGELFYSVSISCAYGIRRREFVPDLQIGTALYELKGMCDALGSQPL